MLMSTKIPILDVKEAGEVKMKTETEMEVKKEEMALGREQLNFKEKNTNARRGT